MLYHEIYKSFSLIEKFNAHITCFVVMPNHIHFICYLNDSSKSLNRIIGNLKRFWAYSIVEILKNKNEHELLKTLQKGVQENEKKKGKKHQIFRLSFDAKECFDRKMLEQKIQYIHENPVNGKWNLAKTYVEYKHSSAAYYELGAEKPVFLLDYREVS